MKLSPTLAALLIGSASLHAASLALNPLSVTASTIDDKFDSQKQEASNVTVISGETVDAAHAENIQQILNSVPGLTTEIQSGDSLKIHIRGVENQRYMGEKPGVAIVIDGVPVFERTGRVNIDLDNIESIKVIKGGASYLFGEDALSGAVIITTKRGAKNAYNALGFETGNFGYRKYLARTGYANNDLNVYVQATRRTSDGYWEDSDYDTRYLNSKLQYYIDDTSDVTAGVEISRREKDSHGTVKGVTQALTNPRSYDDGSGDRDYTRMYDVALEKYFLTYSKEFGDNTNLMVNAYQYNDETDFLSAPIKYDTSGTLVTDDDAYSTGNDYYQIQRGIKSEFRTTTDALGILFGLDFRDNYYENKARIIEDYASRIRPTVTVVTAGTITQDDETDENVYAAYGELKYAWSDALVLTTNARYDHITMDYTDNLHALDLDKSFDVGSYRVGATYAFNAQASLYTNVSTGFRAPTVDQLFAGDISPTGTTLSNPDLKPETSMNYEIGLRGTAGFFEYDAAIFQIDRDDYIMATVGQYASIDKSIPDDANQYRNIGGMRNRGFELALNTDRSKRLYAELAYSFIDARFTQYDNFNLILGNPYSNYTVEHYDLSGKRIPRVSKHTGNFRVNYLNDARWLWTLELNARSRYYADELNRLEIPGYAVVNLMATYAGKTMGYSYELFAKIDNLTDTFYYNTARASGDNNYDGTYDAEDLSLTVNPGRVLTAGLSVKF